MQIITRELSIHTTLSTKSKQFAKGGFDLFGGHISQAGPEAMPAARTRAINPPQPKTSSSGCGAITRIDSKPSKCPWPHRTRSRRSCCLNNQNARRM